MPDILTDEDIQKSSMPLLTDEDISRSGKPVSIPQVLSDEDIKQNSSPIKSIAPQPKNDDSLRQLLAQDTQEATTPDKPVVTDALNEVNKAGERYPAGAMKTVEDTLGGKIKNPWEGIKDAFTNIYAPNPDKRSATEIAQDIGDKAIPPAEIKNPEDAGQYWGAFAKDFMKDLPFTTLGATSELANPVNALLGGATSKLPPVNIPAPAWVDNAITGFIKNAGTPFTSLNEAAKTHATNAIVDEIFTKVQPRIDELKQNFKDVYGRQATDEDIKNSIRSRLDAEGIQNSNLGQLATRLFGLKAQAPLAPGVEAPAALPVSETTVVPNRPLEIGEANPIPPVGEAPQMPQEPSKPVLTDSDMKNAPIVQPGQPETPALPMQKTPVIVPDQEKKLNPITIDNFNQQQAPLKTEDIKVDPELIDKINQLQDELGKQITISSGYRTPEYNQLLKSQGYNVAENSLHLQGRAADIPITKDLTHQEIIDAAHKVGLDVEAISLTPKHVHVELPTENTPTFELQPKVEQVASQPQAETANQGAQEIKAPVSSETLTEEKTGVRGLSKGVETKAIENNLTKGFGNLPEYEKVDMKDQAQKAKDLIDKDYDQARRIAMGEEKPPEGLLPESVFVAVENKAIADRDVNTLRDLSVLSNLTTEATTMGQRIRTLAERNPDSPTGAIKEIQIAREKAAAKRLGVKDVKQAKSRIVKEIKEKIVKVAYKKEDWKSFIESIEC